MSADLERDHPLLKQNHWAMIKCTELEEWKQRIAKYGEVVSKPKIQRVPDYMRKQVAFEKFYSPKLISIGSLHDEPFGQEYKYMWTAMYLEDSNQTARDLCERILNHSKELTNLFAEEYVFDQTVKWVIDGCSVLQVLDKSDHSDPERVLKVSTDQLVRVHEDLLLLENQLPYQLLKILCNDQAKLKKCMHNFLQVHGIVMASGRENLDLGKEKKDANTGGELAKEHKVIVQGEDRLDQDEPVHLLDYLRKNLLMSGKAQIPEKNKINRKSLHLRKYRIGTIRELRAAGIRVKKDPNNSLVYPSFVAGQLQLPELIVDGSTTLFFLNLIAYELCPDFRNDLEISSYIVFLSSLIDDPEDVKELRSAGILHNELASDKEVADLFNRMESILVPETVRYAQIRNQIEEHIKSQRGKIKILGWMGEAYNIYFHSPWTIIALLAATLVLVLTLIQTWFAIHPKEGH